jgi:Carboxypeptidase regulatory-like domain
MNRATFRHAPAFLVLLLGSARCLAQVDRAGLNGTVRDSAGNRVPGAHIIAVQATTGLHRDSVSSPTGMYDIPELPVGVYTIAFEHAGFKSVTFVDVKEAIGRTRILDATLSVAGGEERVEVTRVSALS